MRIRTIKPELWTSRTIAKLSDPWEILLFLGLLNYADDDGRGLSDPTLIRAALFPLREEIQPADVERMLRRLRDVGLLTLYRARAKVSSGTSRGRGGASGLYQIRAWEEHQRIDRRRESLYPGPKTRSHRSTTDRRVLDEGSSRRPRRNGREGKGKEVGEDRALVESTGAGSTPNGAGAYDPDRVGPAPYDVPIPELLEATPDPEPEEERPRARPISSYADLPNPWADLKDPLR